MPATVEGHLHHLPADDHGERGTGADDHRHGPDADEGNVEPVVGMVQPLSPTQAGRLAERAGQEQAEMPPELLNWP